MLRKSNFITSILLLLPILLLAQKHKPKSRSITIHAPITVTNNKGENSLTFKSLGAEKFLDFVISDQFGRIIFFGENFRNGSSLSLAMFQRGTYSIYFSGTSINGRNHQFTVGRDF